MGETYRYPPDVVLNLRRFPGSFSRGCAGLILLAAIVDLVLFGFPTTSIPYNYPFFGDILLLALTVVLLRLAHRSLWRVVEELARIVRDNEEDPLAFQVRVAPEDIRGELHNVLFLSFHPGILAGGALAGGLFVFGIMAVLDVFSAYPYLVLNFGFGAAHGVFFGPVIGGLYLFRRATTRYITDINLLDPDGVGGYREIGDLIVRLATYGIFFVTLDFVILSSVAFTEFTAFQQVVTVVYLVQLSGFVLVTFAATLLIRRKLLEIRDEKVRLMQQLFNRSEHHFWQKLLDEDDTLTEAVNILSMYTMFHQLSRMHMWPINLYSLTRLTLSVGFSLAIFIVENTGFLL